jgi:hypothetical protein
MMSLPAGIIPVLSLFHSVFYWVYKLMGETVSTEEYEHLYGWSHVTQSPRLFVKLRRLRNATNITSPSSLPYRPSSALRQQFHSPTMRLLSSLEYEPSFGASWVTYFVRIPKAN